MIKKYTLSALSFLIIFNCFGQWTQTDFMTGLVPGFAEANGKLFAGSNGGVFVSDNGLTWVDADGALDLSVEAITSVDGVLLAADVAKGIYRSANGGVSWTRVNPQSGMRCFVTLNGKIFSSGYLGVQVSSDKGITWIDAEDGLPKESGSAFVNVSSMTAFKGNLYAASGGKLWKLNGAQTQWISAYTANAENSAGIGSIQGKLYAYVGQKNLVSVDGSNWSATSNPVFFNDKVISGVHTYYTGSGVKEFTDQTTTTAKNLTGNLPTTSTYGIALFKGNLLVSAQGRGIWARVITTGIVELAAESISLYPNPAQDQVTVSIAEEMADAVVVILDHTGKSCAEIAVGSGKSFTLTVSALSPGAYFVELHGNGVIGRKAFVKL
ncbi:MAG: T9SS type A sorting domain-containing protein [Bacteroidota bacterium]